jgi:hypothetical protein
VQVMMRSRSPARRNPGFFDPIIKMPMDAQQSVEEVSVCQSSSDSHASRLALIFVEALPRRSREKISE